MKETEFKQQKKTVSRKTVDKWKKKQWYEIIAPSEFKRVTLGDTIASKPELLKGRHIKVSLRKLSNQIKKQFVEIIFEINDVKGNKAYAESIGLEVPESFIKKFIRRKSSKIQMVQDAKTKDNAVIHVKSMVLTARKTATAQRTVIRRIMEKEIALFCANSNKETIISDLLNEELPKSIADKCKKIVPVKRIEVIKARVYREKEAQEQKEKTEKENEKSEKETGQ